ncbi:hypothetical protein I6763_07295 [Helicobacter pylori]|nr:hypothetical protein [Helicobacter pylori]MBH0265438.1 hypothetical protein [Helicobacter pylori]MBH0266912.1 hypothetical protein [Helicobacter pylori]
MMTPLIKNLNSSSLARILFYSIKSNQLLMEEILTLIFKFLLLEKRGLQTNRLIADIKSNAIKIFDFERKLN